MVAPTTVAALARLRNLGALGRVQGCAALPIGSSVFRRTKASSSSAEPNASLPLLSIGGSLLDGADELRLRQNETTLLLHLSNAVWVPSVGTRGSRGC